MKKTWVILAAVMLACCLQNVAWATVWNDLVVIDKTFADTSGSYSWAHALPGGDFSAPPDIVNSASLAITAKRATESNDLVYYYLELDETYLGFLLAGNGNSVETTAFDLGTLFIDTDWAAGEELIFGLEYSQPDGKNNTLTLVSSLFTLDYTAYVGGNSGGGFDVIGDSGYGGPTPIPNPEPSTMVLLGSGLLGLIYVGRSRRRK